MLDVHFGFYHNNVAFKTPSPKEETAEEYIARGGKVHHCNPAGYEAPTSQRQVREALRVIRSRVPSSLEDSK